MIAIFFTHLKEEEMIREEMVAELEESGIDTAKNIQETKEKVAQDVEETYVKSNDKKDKDEDEKKKKEKRKRGKVVAHLPAREWAIIYRNLKPLLRPCGDLGKEFLWVGSWLTNIYH